MIQPLKFNSNISFSSNMINKQNATQAVANDTQTVSQPDEFASMSTDLAEPKKSLKTKVVNALKTFNDVKDTTDGVVKGVVKGATAFTLIGVTGKRIKDAKGQIFGTVKGLAKSAASTVISVIKAIPAVFTNSPIQNTKKLASLPGDFYKRNLKGNKKTAALATVVGLGIAAFETIKGKIKANENNADIDHKLYLHHAKNNKN